MFFFIGGVQPRTVDLDSQPRMCNSCGLYQARLKRIDHYISIFFLPVIRIKKGVPFLRCDRCGKLSSESVEDVSRYAGERTQYTCPNCGRETGPDFQYCPFCGKQL